MKVIRRPDSIAGKKVGFGLLASNLDSRVRGNDDKSEQKPALMGIIVVLTLIIRSIIPPDNRRARKRRLLL